MDSVKFVKKYADGDVNYFEKVLEHWAVVSTVLQSHGHSEEIGQSVCLFTNQILASKI
jgi:hypothetical protein